MLTNKKLRGAFAQGGEIPGTGRPARLHRCVAWLLAAGLAFVSGCTPAGPGALLEGRGLIKQGKYSEAIDKLRLATTLLPTNALAWNYLGLAYHHAGEAVNAVDAYHKAIKLNHELVVVHYDLGCLFLEQNKPNLNEAARDELMAFTLHQENSLDGHLKLGAAQLRLGELAQAEGNFREALRISPQSAEAMNGIGMVQAKHSRSRDAIAWFDAALKQQPEYPAALLNVAIVLQSSVNSRAQALQKYQQYLALNPRPANWEAVNAAERQLNQELNPPVTPVVRPPASAPVVTQAAAVHPVTNSPGHATVGSNSPPKSDSGHQMPAPPQTNAKAANPVTLASNSSGTVRQAPVVERVEPTEVVQVSDAPSARVADDAVPRAVAVAPTAPPPAVASVDSSAVADGNRSVSSGAKPKTFLQRMNPANIFRRDGQNTAGATDAQPTEITLVSPETQHATPPRATVSRVAGAGRDNEISLTNRYAYRHPPKPPAGDRLKAERLFAEAREAQREQRGADAVAGYRAALQADPSFFEAQCNLGLSASDANDMALSLATYENALAIQPDSYTARISFALALRKAGYIIDSAQELERLLTVNATESAPHLAAAHLMVANLYAEQFHQPRAARPHYLKVLDLDPTNTQATTIRYWLTENP